MGFNSAFKGLKLPQNEDYVSHPYKGKPTAVVLYTLIPWTPQA